MLIFSILNHPFCYGLSLSLWCFFYISKLLFSGFLQLKGNFVPGQNNPKYRD